MMKSMLGTALLFLYGSSHSVSAFSVVVAPTAAVTSQRRTRSHFAVIYYDDGYSEDDFSSSSSSFDFASHSDTNTNSNNDWVSALSETCDAATLARLACAFAPPGHEIHPNELTSAQLLSVDDQHIEISAVICDTEACVTVAVPVTFPQECKIYFDDYDGSSSNYSTNKNNMQACVMDNLQTLDTIAIQRIQQQEWKNNHQEDLQQKQKEVLMELQQQPDQQAMMDLPSWWVSPDEEATAASSYLLPVDEYQNIKNLLNEEEFRTNHLMSLATRTCTELYPLDTFEILQTAVAMVGPAGLLLRAQVKILPAAISGSTVTSVTNFNTPSFNMMSPENEQAQDPYYNNNNNNGDFQLLLVDLPVPFARRVATVDELHSNVLGLVEA